MSLSLTTRIINPTEVLMRLVAYPGEAYRLPEGARHVRIQNGHAWLSVQGRDVVLGPGEHTALNTSAEAAIVSPLGNAMLVLEVLNEPQAKTTPQRPMVTGTAKISPLLAEALRQPSNSEADWLWLAERVPHPAERRFCLLYALFINPRSQVARRALADMARLVS